MLHGGSSDNQIIVYQRKGLAAQIFNHFTSHYAPEPFTYLFKSWQVTPFGKGRSEQENFDLLSRLAEVMQFGSEEDNPKISAGYTYLLQFIAHDISFNENLSPDVATTTVDIENTENLRHTPLKLETVFGRGPRLDPWLYEFEEGNQRYKLKIGKTKDGIRTLSDLPRIPRSSFEPGSGPSKTNHDPLIADLRNEDVHMLSQITVLLHKFHNQLCSNLEAENLSASDKFHNARWATVEIYRNIIRNDLLPLLCQKSVLLRCLSKTKIGDFIHLRRLLNNNQIHIPVEFSAGVFRFAHAMIQPDYRINRTFSEPLGVLTDFNSTSNADKVPILERHRLDTAMFFDHTHPSKMQSRAICPSYTSWLITSALFRQPGFKGGLAFRDLSRAYSLQIANGQSAARAMGLSASEILSEGQVSEILSKLPNLERQDNSDISSDTPILIYILCEAHIAKLEGQTLLGPLGSAIVCEVILGLLTHYKNINAARKSLSLHKILNKDSVPNTMKDLINLVQQ